MTYESRADMIAEIKNQLQIRKYMDKIGYLRWADVARKYRVSKQNVQERRTRILNANDVQTESIQGENSKSNYSGT